MSLADLLLIGWWIAVIAFFMAWLAPRSRYWARQSSMSLAVCIFLFVCWLVIFWLSNETLLYVLTFQIYGLAFGGLCIWLTFAGRNNLKLRPLFDRAIRIF